MQTINQRKTLAIFTGKNRKPSSLGPGFCLEGQTRQTRLRMAIKRLVRAAYMNFGLRWRTRWSHGKHNGVRRCVCWRWPN